MRSHRKRTRKKILSSRGSKQNEDTIHALKRPKSQMLIMNEEKKESYSKYNSHPSRIDNNTDFLIMDTRASIKCNCMKMIIPIVIMSIIIFTIQETNCDVICQKDISYMHPCKCQNGTSGLLISCSKTNLASLSTSLARIRDPVEQLELNSCSISRLFGGIFSNPNEYPALHGNSSLRELTIRSSGLKQILNDTFSSQLTDSIQYLQFDSNQLAQIPTRTLDQFYQLKLLNLSSNALTSIETNQLPKTMSNLSELDLSWNRISRLGKNAFGALTSLELLNLNGNELTKLEKNIFAFGRKLKHLDLSNNKLSSLDRQDLSELTALESLSLANNQLTSIPRSIFSRNGKLYSLDLSSNQLEDIDTYLFKSVRFLKELNVSSNKIRELGKNVFSATTRIKRINVAHNQLQALGPETFKNLDYIERINLAHNQIVNISNDAFNHMFQVDIDLSHNKLQRIFYWSFKEVANMTKLNLSHNLLSDGISQIAFSDSDCTELDISHNLIEDLSKIPISNFTGIRYLDVSHNQITELNKKSFSQKVPLYELSVVDASHNNISQITGNILERLRSIRMLNLSHNSLRRLTSGAFGNSPTLLELDLSHNNLVEVVAGTLVGLVSLKSLNITHNRLKKMIPIPVALNYIYLGHNEISQLAKSAFPSLNSLLQLHLDYNRIAQLEDSSLATLLALNTLSLRHNSLSSIPANGLKDLSSLQNLWLDGNQIKNLSRRAFGPAGLPIVFDLSLSHNNLTHLADSAFEGLLQLISLNLSHNQLGELQPEVFKGLVSLRQLDLSNNRITRIENKTKSSMDDLLSLENLNLSFNKLSMITARTFISSAYIPQRLVHLDLSNNLIGIIINNFADGMRRLEWLSLRNNIINEIYPNVLSNATRLKHLDLSHNKLRTLREGALVGSYVNLSSLSLASNKLASLAESSLLELDRMTSLESLDLSSNKLETFFPEFGRWLRRGTVLDLRNNALDCGCHLLPLVSWIESIMARNNSFHSSSLAGDSDYLARILGTTIDGSNRGGFIRSRSSSGWQKLLKQYLRIGKILNETSCTKPEILSAKQLTQVQDFTTTRNMPTSLSLSSLNPNPNTNNKDALVCDPILLAQSDNFKLLRAPIQYDAVQSYRDEETADQMLRVSWFLAEPQLDLVNFVLIKARFRDAINLGQLRSSRGQLSSQKYNLIELNIDRASYSQRVHSYRNLESSGHHLICLTYELGESNSEPDLMIETLGQANSIMITNGSSESATNILDNMVADTNRFNCVDLAQLLHHDSDTSERLMISSSSSLQPLILLISSFYLCHSLIVIYRYRLFLE